MTRGKHRIVISKVLARRIKRYKKADYGTESNGTANAYARRVCRAGGTCE